MSLCLAAVMLTGCGGSDSETSYDTAPGTSVIVGNVVSFDAATAKVRAAVAGVTVSLFGASNTTTTDSNGEFELTGVAPGSYKIVFEFGGGMGQYALTVVADSLIELKDIVIGGNSTVEIAEETSGPLPEPAEAVVMVTVYWCDDDVVKQTEITQATYDADPSSYSTEAPDCESPTLPLFVIEPIPIMILPFVTLDDGDSYHFLSGTRGSYTGGDFYFAGSKFYANNVGQRGTLSLGDTGSQSLSDIEPPAAGYTRFGTSIVSGHTYVARARELGHHIVFRVTGFSAGNSVSLQYVYK